MTANDDRQAGALRLPTLTEVVEFTKPAAETTLLPEGPPQGEAAAGPSPDVDQLVTRVLAELAPRIERLLQARLREALAPALARAADGLIRDARDELSGTLRALVEESVARVLEQRERR